MTSRTGLNRVGALLLEVVVSLAIVVTSMGFLSAQLVSGIKLAGHSQNQVMASYLSERVLMLLELDIETVEEFFAQRELESDFGEKYLGWFWRAEAEEFEDNPELYQVRVEILRQPDPEQLDMIEGAKVVRVLHMVKATPARINLAEDFGIPEEQLELMSAAIPIDGIDPLALDPQALVSIPPDMLLELMPMVMPLMQQFRSGGALPPGFAQGDINGLLQGGGAGALNGPQGDQLREYLREQLGGQVDESQIDAFVNQLGGAGMGGGRGGGGGRGPMRPGPGGGFGRGAEGGGAGGEAEAKDGGGNFGGRGGERGGERGGRSIRDLQRGRDNSRGNEDSRRRGGSRGTGGGARSSGGGGR